MNRCLFVPSAIACAIASQASAQVVLQSDQRALVIETVGSVQTAVPSAPFASFDLDISKNLPGNGGGNGMARATQTSSVSTGVFNASGTCVAEANAGPANCILSQATTDFRIVFKVNGPVSYVSMGFVEGAEYRLADSVLGAINFVQAAVGTQKEFSFEGTLRPGRTYTMLAQSSHLVSKCNGQSLSQFGHYSLNASFISLPECPGDLNFDRVVDDLDFSLFAVAYDAFLCPDPPKLCEADLNHDTFVDDADFSLFAVAYDNFICP